MPRKMLFRQVKHQSRVSECHRKLNTLCSRTSRERERGMLLPPCKEVRTETFHIVDDGTERRKELQVALQRKDNSYFET